MTTIDINKTNIIDIFNNIQNKDVPSNWDVSKDVDVVNRHGVEGTVTTYNVRVFEEDDNYSFSIVCANVRTRFTVQIDGHTFACDNKRHSFYRLFNNAYPQNGYIMREDNNYSDKQEWASLECDVESWMGWRYANGLWLRKPHQS